MFAQEREEGLKSLTLKATVMTAPENKDLIDRKQGKNNRASSVARTLTRL